MSWFKRCEAYADHMKFREKEPDCFPVKYGTNNHSDHSKVLSEDLSVNQRLVDTLFYRIESLLPSKTLHLPLSIEIKFSHEWVEYNANKSIVIGRYLPYKLLQDGKVLRAGRLLLTSLGNRGEPASVYEDKFSRFLIIELKLLNSSNSYDGITQYGFHKYLHAKDEKLLSEYKILGVRKNFKLKMFNILRKYFGTEVTDKYISMPVVKINEENDEQLISFIQHLFMVGIAKEIARDRLPEISLKR